MVPPNPAEIKAFIKRYGQYQDAAIGDDAKRKILGSTDFEIQKNKYYTALFMEPNGPERAVQLALRLREECVRITDILGIGSGYEQSITWAVWDIAKQVYLKDHPGETDLARYYIGNPLTDARIQQSIVDRHIGWEFHMCVTYRDPQSRLVAHVAPLLPSKQQVAFVQLARKPPKTNGQLSSSDYSILGMYVRTALKH